MRIPPFVWHTVFIALFVTGTASAQSLSIQDNGKALQPVESTPVSTPISLPVRGLSMEYVETHYGAPQQKNAAVGNPPISSWIYPDFSVYFEYRYIIHAVSRRK